MGTSTCSGPNKDQLKIDWYKEMQGQLGIIPYVKIEKPSPWVNQVYYKQGSVDILFFSNYSLQRSFNSMATFDAQGKTAWWWDTATGERYLYPVDKGTFEVKLEPGESKVIVFGNDSQGKTFPTMELDGAKATIVPGPWHVRLEHIDGASQNIVLDKLVDFKENEFLQNFAGIAYYENTFSIASGTLPKMIDLGKVHGVSELTVNGENVGVRWHSKHLFDVSSAIKDGENSMQIKVTTTLGNYLKSLTDNKDSQKWMRSQPLYSIGLIGPIRIL